MSSPDSAPVTPLYRPRKHTMKCKMVTINDKENPPGRLDLCDSSEHDGCANCSETRIDTSPDPQKTSAADSTQALIFPASSPSVPNSPRCKFPASASATTSSLSSRPRCNPFKIACASSALVLANEASTFFGVPSNEPPSPVLLPVMAVVVAGRRRDPRLAFSALTTAWTMVGGGVEEVGEVMPLC